MNVFVAGTSLNQSEETKAGASINIKNNKENGAKSATGVKSSFASVIVSGMQIDKSKLDSNTYESLVKQTDDVKEQIKSSAADAKISLKALFNRLSGADAVKIDQDGFNLTDATADDMVNIVDRIKIQLAANGDSSQLAGSNISMEQIQQVVGSEGMANEVYSKLQAGNVPVTQDNVSEAAGALDKVSQITTMSENAKNYLVANQLEPTIDHVYMAEHIQQTEATTIGNAALATANTEKVAAEPTTQTTMQTTVNGTDNTVAATSEQVTDEQWQQLRPQVEKIIAKAGLAVNEQNLNNAKTFIAQQIPVTEENLTYKASLDNLNLANMASEESQSAILDKIVDNMTAGERAGSTLLTSGMSAISQVADAINTLNSVDYRHVAAVTESGQPFTIASLKDAIMDVGEAVSRMSSTVQNESVSSQRQATSVQAQSILVQNDQTNTAQGKTVAVQTQTVDNYRQLQEARILLTAQAGLFLVKQGVNLNTIPITQLASELSEYDKTVTLSATAVGQQTENDAQDAVKVGLAMEESQTVDATALAASASSSALNSVVSSYQTVLQVKRALFEIKNAPDVSIGTVINEKEAGEALTISDFAEMGSNLRQRFEQAGQTYEAVQTTERKDLGDSVQKAVDASTDDILNGIGLENTQANRDAVRILGYNSMEMTKENVTKIKEIHATLNSLIDNMKPEAVLDMIRNNINPMTDDINTVNQYLTQQNTDSNSEEKFSHFLYKLDKTGGITQEERSQFIGIYKMMNLFTKDAGAAIGALVKQNTAITMENLCTAYNSKRAAGMDTTVDDTAGTVEATGTVNYYNNLFAATASSITPLTLKKVNGEQTINSRSAENFCEAVDTAYDSAEEAQYYEEYLSQIRTTADADAGVIKELTANKQPVTVNNIQAMESIMQTGYFNSVFGKNSKNSTGNATDDETSNDAGSGTGKDASGHLSEVIDGFLDKIGNRQELEAEYDKLAKNQTQQLADAISGAENQTYENMNALRVKNKEIGLIQNLSLRHDYKIPYATQDGIGTIHLTLVQDEENQGRISVSLNDSTLGNVSVEAKVSSDTIGIFAVSDSTSDAVTLKSRLETAADSIRQNYDIDHVTVYCNEADSMNRITYENAADTTATDQLYGMAKTIVYSLIGRNA